MLQIYNCLHHIFTEMRNEEALISSSQGGEAANANDTSVISAVSMLSKTQAWAAAER